jgi:hypothetical protein
VVLAVASLSSSALAQEEEEIVIGQWYNDLAARISGAQTGFSNWQGGGINSVSISAGLTGRAQKTDTKFKQTHDMRLGLGGISQNDEALRKAEDIIFLGTTGEYLGGSGFLAEWHPTVAATLLTQFIEGFDFGQDPKAKVSDLFSPAYLTQSLGLTRQFRPWLSQRFGVAAKETVVNLESLRPLYGNDADETVRVEGGLESRTDVQKEIAPNVMLRSTLGLFASFSSIDTPDAAWENLITMKVNDWLNVGFEYVTLYDRDVSTKAQIREVLSVGILFVLR